MAFPNQKCGPVDVPCCEDLWDQGNAILEAVTPALVECLVDTTTCCGETGMRFFVSLGPPQLWQTDFLAVYLEPPGFVYSPGSQLRTGNMILPPLARALWRIYLLESCYPGLIEVGDTSFATPDDDDLHLANRHAYAHGEALLRGAQAIPAICEGFALRDMQPVGPVAGPGGWSAGWSLGITVDLTLGPKPSSTVL